MKLLIFFCLLAFALAEEECGEERAETCVENLLNALLDDITEEQVCGELRTSIECLRNAVDECLGDEKDEKVEEGLKELDKVLRENCEEDGATSEGEGEMEKCFSENEEYIYECIHEGSTQALTLLMQNEKFEENALKCLMYGLMSECFVERVGEKCGEKAKEEAKNELIDDVPVEIKDACEAADLIELTEIDLLGDKRKK